ncbi:unnamed protein product, partial [Rotaria sp. Silwood2]
NFRQTTGDNKDVQLNIIYLSHFIHLPNAKILEFQSRFPIDRWKDVEFILQAYSNVINFIIVTPFLVLSKFHDNLSLMSVLLTNYDDQINN